MRLILQLVGVWLLASILVAGVFVMVVRRMR